MAGINDLLSNALGMTTPNGQPTSNAILPNPATEAINAKKAEVAQASEAKKTAFGGIPDFYNVAAAQGGTDGLASAGQLEQDVRTLNQGQLWLKYGDQTPEILRQMADGQRGFSADRASTRDVPQVIGDSISGAAGGLVGGLGNIAALGVGLVDDEAGAALSAGVDSLNNWVQGSQSDAVAGARRVQAARSANTSRDNELKHVEDIANGDTELVAGLKQFGRDFVDSVGNSSDQTFLAQGSAEAAGSLLAGSPIAAGLRKIGTAVMGGAARQRAVALAAQIDRTTGVSSAARVADRARRIGGGAAWPLATAALEGGGAYTGAVNEVMGMSHEDLLNGSPEYRALLIAAQEQGIPSIQAREQAKIQLANQAGEQAAAIQAPIAGVTGLMTRAFERPFHIPSVGAAARNVLLNEPLEEAIQSSTGQLAQNIGVQANADQDLNLAKGVGEQGAQGALFGMTSAGAVQAPAAALKGTRAVYRGAKTAVAAAVAAGKPLYTALVERGDRILRQQEQASPVSDAALSTAANNLNLNAAQAEAVMTEAVNNATIDEAVKAAGNEYVSSLVQALQFDTAELEGAPEAMRQAVGQTTSRAEAIIKLADLVNKSTDDQDTLNNAAVLWMLMEPVKSLQEADPEAFGALPKDSPALLPLQQYTQVVNSIEANATVRRALRAVDSMLAQRPAPVQPVTEESLATPEGQQNVQNAIAVSALHPDKANLEANQQILTHAAQGKLNLTPIQLNTLKASVNLLRARSKMEQQIAASGIRRAKDVVSSQIVAGNDPLRKDAKSALQHTQEILSAMRGQNTELAAARLEDFGKFVQHMQNKVAALNTHFEDGNPNADGVQYQQLQPGSREFKLSKDGMFVNTNKGNSIDLAQSAAIEASTLADVYNGLVDTFPELGQQTIAATPLNPALVGDSETLATAFRAARQPAKKAAPAVQSQPVETTDDTQRQPADPDTATPDLRVGDDDGRVDEAPTPARVDEPIRREADEAPTQTAEESTGDTRAPVADVPSVVPGAVEASEQPAAVVPTTPLADLYGENNYARSSFSYPETQTSRLVGEDSPIASVRRALSSEMRLNAFLSGSSKRNTLEPNTAAAYQRLLTDSLAPVGIAVQEQLHSFLQSNYSKALPRTMQDIYLNNVEVPRKSGTPLAGSEMNRLARAKVLNLTQQDSDGDLVYQPQMLEQSLLASMQWLLSADSFSSVMDETDVAEMTGLSETVLQQNPELIEQLTEGLSLTQAKRSLSDKIRKYWGVSAKSTADLAYAEGIPDAMAAELLRAMDTAGLIELNTIELTPAEHGIEEARSFIRVLPVELEDAEALSSYQDAIEVASLVEPEHTNFIGEEIPPVAQRQMNNNEVANTTNQKDALGKEQQTPLYVNLPMVSFYTSLGRDNLLSLSGEPLTDSDVYNDNHLKAVEGRNKSITAAFDHLFAVVADVSNAASTADVELDQMPIRYGYNMSRVGRMQMLGKYSPQASKLVREAILPTRSTLDLSNENSEQFSNYALGLAQAVGIKVHNQDTATSVAQVITMLNGPLSPAVDVVREWLGSADLSRPTELTSELSPEAINTIRDSFKAAKADLGFVGLHALVDYARFLAADDLSAFQTSMYLEADGVTNGPINAMALMSIGNFTPAWVNNIAKGGMTFGPASTMADIRRTDSKDLYQASTDAARARLSEVRNTLGQEGSEQMDHLLSLMSLFNSDVLFNPDAAWEDGALELKRGIAKNPLTITIYGSGEAGIAGKLTSALVTEIYARMSTLLQAQKANPNISVADAMFPNDVNAAEKLTRFSDAIAALTTSFPKLQKGELVFDPVHQPARKFVPKTFTFTKSELETMQANMLHLFVKPMRQGIADTVGEPLMKAVAVLRDAAQVQSIFLEQMYRDRVDEALIEKEKTDPNWRRGDFLSRADLNKITAGLRSISPLVQTGDQSFLISGQQALELAGRDLQYGRALNDTLRTDPSIYAPAQAGVRAIPMMTIGMGDGMMMQLLAQQGLEGTLKIFDGMNMPLDKIGAYSEQANAAVYESWKGNPHAEMLKTFDKFLSEIDIDDITDYILGELARTLYSPEEMRYFRQQNTSPNRDETYARINSLRDQLAWSAKSIDARHAAIESLPVSVDQMAAAAQPFTNGRAATARMTTDEAVAALNKAYQAAMAGGAVPVTAPLATVPEVPKAVAPAIEKVGRVAASGVRVLSPTAMDNLSRTDMTEAQKAVYSEIRRSKAAEGYKVVAGTPAQIDAFIADTGRDARPSQDVHGWINVGDKTIYMINPSTETLVHELVHAASYETLLAYYRGDDLGTNKKEITEAIERLESMMSEFLAMDSGMSAETEVTNYMARLRQNYSNEFAEFDLLDANPDMTAAEQSRWEQLDTLQSQLSEVEDFVSGELMNTPPIKKFLGETLYAEAVQLHKSSRSVQASPQMDSASRTAFDSARSAILSSNLESDQAVAQAKALNEFMAWGLTNEQLTKTLKEKPAPALVRLAKGIVSAIKSLIWGKKVAPKPADDFLSNLQFNSGVIFRTQPTIGAVVRDGELYHSTAADGRRMDAVRQAFTQKIADLLNGDKWKRGVQMQQTKVSQAVQDAVSVGLSFEAHGFSMDQKEGTTFRMIVAALATEAEIDSNSLDRAQELYTHVAKTLSVEDFMADPQSLDPAMRYYAQEKYSVIMGQFLTTTDAQGRSSLLPAFLALATVNDEFRSVLSKMKLPASIKNKDGTLDAILENVGTTAMDSLSRRLSGDTNSKTVLASVDNLLEHIRKEAQNEQSYLDQYASTTGGIVDRANDIVINGVQAASDALLAVSTAAEKNASSALVRNTARLGQLVAAVASEKNGNVVAEGIMTAANSTKMWEPLRTFIGDLVGRTESNANVYDMIKAVRSSVQQSRQQFRDSVPQIINSKFKKQVTPAQWTSMFNVLAKTDLALLRQSMQHADIAPLIADQSARDAEINKLEAQIQSTDARHWPTISRKAKQLATFMNTGVPGVNLLRNAEAIGRLLGERKANNFSLPNAQTKAAIDKLVTLYALDGLPESDRAVVSSLVQSEADGINFVVDYLMGQRKEEVRKATGTAMLNAYKGYIPSEQEAGVSMQVASDAEFANLRELGYVRVAPYKGSTVDMGQGFKSYYFAPLSGRAVFNQGIMQNVRHTAGGVDATSGFTVGMTAGRITGKQQIARILGRMAQEKSTVETLMPVYNSLGEVVALERSVDPKIVARLNKSTDLARMIGVWRGRQAEEATSQIYNDQLIANLKAMYDADMKVSSSNQKQYINLLAPRTAKENPVIADAVSLFTNETLAAIKATFGEEFWVRRDMVRDAIGERSASVGDLWNGVTTMSKDNRDHLRKAIVGAFGVDAYRHLVGAERLLQNFMADMRTLIVVKSVIVPATNFVSNIYQLIGRGVPMLSIAKGMPAKLGEIDSYAKTQLRKIEAEAELRAATGNAVAQRKLTAEIQSITDAHKRMSIWPLIEAGEFSSIADVGMQAEDLELTSGKLASFIERQVDRLPDSVKTAGRYALITKDTALYRGLQKSVQYGDFIAKAVLFDDLTKRQGLTKAEALARITEEFVNYDRLPGRFRSYLENSGLLWFYNFKIRSTKVALSTIRNNPVHALMAMTLPAPDFLGSVGSPISDNIAAKALGDTLGSSVGTDMAFRAPTLNPWMNLIH